MKTRMIGTTTMKEMTRSDIALLRSQQAVVLPTCAIGTQTDVGDTFVSCLNAMINDLPSANHRR
jgi:hypothetical protein